MERKRELSSCFSVFSSFRQSSLRYPFDELLPVALESSSSFSCRREDVGSSSCGECPQGDST